MPPKRTQLPAPSAPAGMVPVQAIQQKIGEVRAADDAGAVNAARKWASNLVRSVLLEKDAEQVGEALYAAAELQAWACRRLGELFPSRQGVGGGRKAEGSDLLSAGEEEAPEPPVSHAALARYRQLAKIPEAQYSAAIAELRGQGVPPTQTALTKLAPRPTKPPRQILVEKTAARITAAAVRNLGDRAGELRELRERAPKFHAADLSARLEQVLAARRVLEGTPAPVDVDATVRGALERAAAVVADAAAAVRSALDAAPAAKADAIEQLLEELLEEADGLRANVAGLAALGLDTGDRRVVDARAQEELRRTGEAQKNSTKKDGAK